MFHRSKVISVTVVTWAVFSFTCDYKMPCRPNVAFWLTLDEILEQTEIINNCSNETFHQWKRYQTGASSKVLIYLLFGSFERMRLLSILFVVLNQSPIVPALNTQT